MHHKRNQGQSTNTDVLFILFWLCRSKESETDLNYTERCWFESSLYQLLFIYTHLLLLLYFISFLSVMVGIWTFRHNEAKIGQAPLFSSIDFVLVE